MATKEDVLSLLPATLEQLVDGTGKSETTIRKAVGELKDEGKLKKEDGQYIATNKPPSVRDIAHERDAAVIDLLTANPTGLSKIDMAEKLGVTERLVYTSIWRLTRREVPAIAKTRDGSRQPKYVIAA